jgi:hypothetical protein
MVRLTLIFAAFLFMALPASVAFAGTSTPCGTVLIDHSSWLGGQGVDVKSNGVGWVGSCKGGSANWGWQCVDLAFRLYSAHGWGRVFAAGDGGAVNIPEGSPSLQFHPNGTAAPQPGDLIIELGTRTNPYGHVAVVDTVSGGVVQAVEQNTQYWNGKSWSDHPRHTYTLHGLSITGGYGAVRGVMHSPKNHLSQPAPAPTQPAPPSATPAKPSTGGSGWMSGAIAALSAAVVQAAATPAAAPPAPAAGAVYRLTSTVNLRAGPGTSYRVVGSLPAGRAVTITCQALGTSVNGSSIWDRLSTSGWVTDYYMGTPRFNAFSPGIPRC